MKIPAFTDAWPVRHDHEQRLVVVPVNMPIDDALVAGNWSHISSKINTKDEVIVVPEDRSWRLHLLVIESGPGFVRTVILHRWEANREKKANEPTADVPVPDGYKIDHTPKTGWRAFTLEPLIEVSRGHPSREAATMAAIAHAAKANAVAA